MRTYLMSLVVALGACTDVDVAPLDRATACQAQADAWCAAVRAPGGCQIWYAHACMAFDSPIPADMQAACLADVSPGDSIPASCTATWGAL